MKKYEWVLVKNICIAYKIRKDNQLIIPYLQYFDDHFFIVRDVYGFKHFTIFAST